MAFKLKHTAVIVTLILAGCGEPATKAQIERAFSNATVYDDAKTTVAYQKSNGQTRELVTTNGTRRRINGRWYAQEGKLCHSYPSTSCIAVYVNEGKVQPPFGLKVASGDVFGLDRNPRRQSNSGNSGLEGLLAGAVIGAAILGKVLEPVCKNGGCSGAVNSGPVSTPVSDNSGGQCKASKSQCYASCEGLSRENKHALVVSSPYQNCRKQCSRISC